MDLPIINKPVTAVCQSANGKIEEFEIRRIITKDSSLGWQWSGIDFNTYFTLKVLSWKYLYQLKMQL